MSATRYKLITLDADQIVGGPHTNVPVTIRLGDDADLALHAHRDGRDIRFTSPDLATDLPYELIPNGHVLTPDGIHTWFNSPRAVYHEGDHNRTYFGAIGISGQVKVGQYDHTTGALSVTGVRTTGEQDDHDNPAILVRPDGKLLIGYTNHDDTRLRFRISANAEDSTAWGSEITVQPDGGATVYTYSNLIYLSEEDRIYCFYRVGTLVTNKHIKYITSDDGGATWSASVDLWQAASGGTPYLKFTSNGVDTIWVFGTDKHPNQGNQFLSCIQYDGAWKDAEGNALGSGPYDYSDATIVHDSSAGDDTVWILDAALDGTTSAVLYNVYPSNSTADHRLYYGRWNGTTFDTQEITAVGDALYAGEPYYNGGAAFNNADPDQIVIGKEVDGVIEVQQWEREGGEWSKTEDITENSTGHNLRPYFVRGGEANEKCRIIWAGNGDYTSFTSWHTALRCYPVRDSEFAYAVVKLPTLDSEDEGPHLAVTYGDGTAVDAQSPEDVYDDNYLAVCSGQIPIRGVLANIASKGTVNGDRRLLGELWDGNPLGGGFTVNTLYSRVNDRYDVTANFAALGQLYMEGWCEFTGTAQQNLFSAWDVDQAGVLFRRRTSATNFAGFVVLQADTQVGTNPFSTLTLANDTPGYVGFGFLQNGTANLYCRVNTTEATSSTANANNMDAGTSPSLRVGNAGGDQTLGVDDLNGAIGRMLVSDILRSKNWTDTLYNLADGSAVTFGAAMLIGFAPPILRRRYPLMQWLRRETRPAFAAQQLARLRKLLLQGLYVGGGK